jgi:hypothetical protein
MTVANSERRLRQIAKAYYIAKQTVVRKGYASEIDWQYSVSLEDLDETTFLREAAWVILCSGFRESTVRRKFPEITRAFLDWQSAREIVEHGEMCKKRALCHFAHDGKVSAIVAVASHLHCHGLEEVVREIKENGILYLQQLPFIGPATSYHLAKNIGLSVAKPDRHLSKIAHLLGYDSIQTFCAEIANATDEPISVVDLVLWRYATIYDQHIDRFATFIRNVH